MTLRNQKSVIWPPAGLSDAIDSSEEEFSGSLSLCSNLIPAQNNKNMLVARPAAIRIPAGTLPDFGGGPITDLLAVGNIVYGMYASAQFTGKDRPFAYDLVNQVFYPIAGMTSANLPTSQPTTGDWTPPCSENVATRVLFTHPGFPDGSANAPYYNVLAANTTNGSPTLTGITSQVFSFLQTGMALFGPGIPANTTIANVSDPTVNTTATGSSGGNTMTVALAGGIAIGQSAFGPGIPANTTVTNLVGTTVTLSANLGQNLSATPVTFTGSVVTMSQNATATATGVGLTVTAVMALKFGWLDLSGLNLTTQGNTASGVPAITGNPTIAGLQPGMQVAGSNIPAGTVVTWVGPLVVTGSCSFSSGSNIVTLQQPAGNGQPTAGMAAAGAGIPAGTVVVSVSGTGNVVCTLNQNTTGAGPATLTFSGAIMGLSQNATATATFQTFTFTGGSPSNPLWGAGDTTITPLAGTPIFVWQLAGSAAFGINTTNPPTSGVTFSDPGIPCQVTNATQAITFRNAVPVTAAAPLQLENQLGGIIQSLIVFQGASNIQQITGSIALGNITVNTSQVATGTFAPNSVANTPKGVIFAAPFGLRIIDYDGRITDPIGAKGMGVVLPFQNVVHPTRMAAAFNENVYRVTLTWQPPPLVQPIYGAAQRTDEFWLHLDQMRFSGPHTSLMDLAVPWISNETFVGALTSGRGALWQSDPDQAATSVYVENGTQLAWTYRTTLLPDDESMYANSLTESSVFASMSGATQWLATFIDDQNVTLDQTYVWIGPNATQAEVSINWKNPIVFRQGSVQIAGNSESFTNLGKLGLRYQKLKYQMTYRPDPEFVLGQSVSGGPDVAGP